jgi:hypothetical protein
MIKLHGGGRRSCKNTFSTWKGWPNVMTKRMKEGRADRRRIKWQGQCAKRSKLTNSDVEQCSGYTTYNGKVSARKKIVRISPCFRNPLHPILVPERLYSLPFRSICQEKKEQWCKRQMSGKKKMGKMVRGRQLPCVRRSWSLYRGRVVCGAFLMSMERKKWWRSKEKDHGKSDYL